MSGLKKKERAVMEAVARHFSAKLEERGDSLLIAGKRVALEVGTIQQRGAPSTKPRLRFDKVVLRVMASLRKALHDAVSANTSVLLTLTAPIRLPGQTVAALEEKIRACLAGKVSRVRWEGTVHGNQARIRVVKSSARQKSKIIGFVHNPDTDAEGILDIVQDLVQHVGAAMDRSVPGGSAKTRWLVLAMEGGCWEIETYRQILGQMDFAPGFSRIVMVFDDGRVEALAG